MDIVSGLLIAGLGGTFAGGLGWPMKLMRKFQFEQCWLVGMTFGLLLLPWLITFAFCPNALEAYKSVEPSLIIRSNLFSLAWGIGNVLLGLSLVRIGSSLSFAILSGIGIPLGVIVPMIFKGTGRFSDAPDLASAAGITILIGTVVMLIGVVFVGLAGFGRDRAFATEQKRHGGFLGGLLMCIVSGFCSVGPSFAFVYSQGPIKEAMMDRGAQEWPALISVWALGMAGGTLVNLLYPAFLLTKNKSWNVLRHGGKELGLSLIVGFNLFCAFTLMFKGMLLLGAFGASIGFGIYFAMQILAGQGLGFISGEWRGVTGKPLSTMYVAIATLILACIIIAYGNNLVE